MDPLFRLTAILTWRFLINLQEAERRVGYSSHVATHLSDVVFQERAEGNVETFVGSLGGELSLPGDDMQDEDIHHY